MQFNMGEVHVALYSIHASIPPFNAKEWRKRNNKVNTYLPLPLSILFLCMFVSVSVSMIVSMTVTSPTSKSFLSFGN